MVGTMLMTTEEVGAYIRMLCLQWEQGSVSSDPGKLARITGLKYKKLGPVLEKFREDSDGNLKNLRMEQVRNEREFYLQQQREKGAKGGRPKGGNEKPGVSCGKATGYAGVSENESQMKAESKPDITPPSPSPSPFPYSLEVQAIIKEMFRRRLNTPWSDKELSLAKKLNISEEQVISDLAIMKEAREEGWEYYRREPVTLFGNWQGEVDKAQDFLANPQITTCKKSENKSLFQ